MPVARTSRVIDDFSDVTSDYPSRPEPRLSDIDVPNWPSLEAIRGFIRAANGWSEDTPISDALVSEFRQTIVRRAYLMWHARIRRRQLPPPVNLTRRQRRSVAVLWDLLQDPWFRVGLAMLDSFAAFTFYSAREVLLFPRYFHDSHQAMASGLLVYAHCKVRPAQDAPRTHWNGWTVNPWHMAALNAVSPVDATQAYESAKVATHHRVISALFCELEFIGRRAVKQHGDWLCNYDSGAPRGLIPYLSSEAVVAAGDDEADVPSWGVK